MKTYLLPALLVLLIACSKGSGTDKDYDAPVVVLNTPINNQVFTAGQSIMISGSVTDNKYITQIHIEITNLHTAAEYQHVHIHPATNSFNFNHTFTAEQGITYKIRVIADDPSTNSNTKMVEVSCN